jgi:hypothetical protein
MYVGEKVEGSTNNDNERGMRGEQSRDGKRKGPRIRVHGVLIRARGGRSEDWHACGMSRVLADSTLMHPNWLNYVLPHNSCRF